MLPTRLRNKAISVWLSCFLLPGPEPKSDSKLKDTSNGKKCDYASMRVCVYQHDVQKNSDPNLWPFGVVEQALSFIDTFRVCQRT